MARHSKVCSRDISVDFRIRKDNVLAHWGVRGKPAYPFLRYGRLIAIQQKQYGNITDTVIFADTEKYK